jgi:hypothetical protein
MEANETAMAEYLRNKEAILMLQEEHQILLARQKTIRNNNPWIRSVLGILGGEKRLKSDEGSKKKPIEQKKALSEL